MSGDGDFNLNFVWCFFFISCVISYQYIIFFLFLFLVFNNSSVMSLFICFSLRVISRLFYLFIHPSIVFVCFFSSLTSIYQHLFIYILFLLPPLSIFIFSFFLCHYCFTLFFIFSILYFSSFF